MEEQGKQGVATPLDANQELARIWGKEEMKTIFQWIADTAIFCPVAKILDPITGARRKTFSFTVKDRPIRRIRPGSGEKKGQVVDGVYLDNNSVINQKFKSLVGYTGCKNYETCHIWQDYAYHAEVFCVVPDIVLLPRVLAKFSDCYQPVIDLLTYRAYELYGWHPDDAPIPQKPEYYPEKWKTPADFKVNKVDTVYVRKSVPELLEMWSRKPDSIVYKTIKIIVDAPKREMSLMDLISALKGISSNPGNTISSLCTDAGHAYGKLLKNENGIISILPEYQNKISSLWK